MAVIWTKQKGDKCSIKEGYKNSNLSLTFEERVRKSQAYVGQKLHHVKQMILFEVFLFRHSIWIKKYRHLTTKFKTGYNARLRSPTTLLPALLQSYTYFKAEILHFPKSLEELQICNKRTPARFGRQESPRPILQKWL